MRGWLVGLLFLLSGATALCYQVAWTRHLVLLFGNTSHAIALILAAYMLGLALGSEWGGRRADRSSRPVVLYALFEVAIGLYAVLFPWLVEVVRAGYLAIGTAAPPVLFLAAFVLLLVPTFLMGTTLPLLVRATVKRAEWTGGTVGWLYGINIVGAVLGAAVTGFWLLEAAGILGATYWSAAVNGLIGVAGLVFLRGATNPARDPEATATKDAPTERSPALAKAALVAVFAAGFVGLAAEVVWTRLLIFFLQGFTYTFSAMLAMFLAGLAIGGFVFGRIARTSERPVEILGRLQVAIGVFAAGVLLLLSNYLGLSAQIFETAGSLAGDGGVRRHHVIGLLLSSAVTLLPPAILMGGVFPLAAAAYQRGMGDLGARVGRLYAVNTAGAVLGSIGAGFVLTPLVGAPWAAATVAVASVVAGTAVLWIGRGARWRWGWPACGAVATIVLLVAANPAQPFILRSHTFAGSRERENRLTRTLQGMVCQVSVVANERENFKLLYTDEFQAAGTKPEYRYMRMLAHLPVALVEQPKDVLVICFGTGTTSGSVSTHRAVERLDIVEISPEVLAVADEFADVNRNVLGGAGRDDLDVNVHVDDGRNFVLRAREQWDVITLEPLMPYTPAAIHFYTRDFYAECKPRLAPGGLMCQWIPLQGMSGDHFLRLVRAFTDVFPGSAVFFVDGAVALVGGNEPLEMPYARVAERLADPEVKADLAAVGYDDPVRALATFVAGGDLLEDYVKDVEAVTDEYPVLEFHPVPSGMVMLHLYENLDHMQKLRKRNARLPVSLEGVADPETVEDRLRLALEVGNYVLEGQFLMEQTEQLLRRGQKQDGVLAFGEARERFALAQAMDASDPAARRQWEGTEREWALIRANTALDAGDLDAAESHALDSLEFGALRQDDGAWVLLATVRNRSERFEEALDAAIEATRRFPRGREGLAERAYARAALGDLAGARADYAAALEGTDPGELDARLANDARRVLEMVEDPAGDRDPDQAIERALAGELGSRVPQRLVLRLLALQHPRAYAQRFERDSESALDPSVAGVERALLLEQLLLAAPPGAADVAERVVLEAACPEPARDAAARLLASADVTRFVALLSPGTPVPALVSLLRAAATTRDRRVADALTELLDHDDPAVRRSSQTALFALVGDAAPALGSLDPDRVGTKPFTAAVALIRSWWVRNRGTFRLRR